MVIGFLKFGIPLLLPLLLKYVVDDVLLTEMPSDQKIESLLWIFGGAFLIFTVFEFRLNIIDNTLLSGQRVRFFSIFGIGC